jgi:hypothetical protein
MTYARNTADDGAVLGLQLVGPGSSRVERRFELRLRDERLRDDAAIRNAVQEGVRQFVTRGDAPAP